MWWLCNIQNQVYGIYWISVTLAQVLLVTCLKEQMPTTLSMSPQGGTAHLSCCWGEFLCVHLRVHVCAYMYIYAGAEVRNMKRRKEHRAQDMFLCFSTEGIRSFSLVIPPYLKQNNTVLVSFSQLILYFCIICLMYQLVPTAWHE